MRIEAIASGIVAAGGVVICLVVANVLGLLIPHSPAAIAYFSLDDILLAALPATAFSISVVFPGLYLIVSRFQARNRLTIADAAAYRFLIICMICVLMSGYAARHYYVGMLVITVSILLLTISVALISLMSSARGNPVMTAAGCAYLCILFSLVIGIGVGAEDTGRRTAIVKDGREIHCGRIVFAAKSGVLFESRMVGRPTYFASTAFDSVKPCRSVEPRDFSWRRFVGAG